HTLCRTCILKILNSRQVRCPMCRADIIDQVPQEILDEVDSTDRIEGDPNVMGSRPRRGHRGRNAQGEDDGYDTADEIEADATHIKIRYGARELGFVRNDGIDKEFSYDDGTVSFRIVY